MITAVLFCALAQIQSTFSLDPVPPCPTCDILMARVASLEARLAAVTGQFEAPRRVRLIEVPQARVQTAPARVVSSRVIFPTSQVTRFAVGPGRQRFPITTMTCGPGGCPP